MYAPTQQLGDLSLGRGDMPTTRAQSRSRISPHRDGELGNLRESSLDVEDNGRRYPVSTVQARSGFEYDNRDISIESWQRAKDGLNGDYDVKYCTEISSEKDGYFAFRMTPVEVQFGVRIGASNTAYETPTCSCDDFQRRHLACKHIFWLTDQFTKVATEELEEPLHLKDDGSILYQASPFEQISHRGLKTLAHDLGWRFRSHPYRVIDEYAFSRKDQIRDILSTFDSSRLLPEEYLSDVYEDVSEKSAGIVDVTSAESLETVIFRLAASDEDIFRPLRDAIDADHCALIYFAKLRDKAAELFAHLREAQSVPDRVEQLDADRLISRIRQIVFKTRSNLEMRAPVGDEAKAKALQLLLFILDQVCDAHAAVVAARPATPHATLTPSIFEILICKQSGPKRRASPQPSTFAEDDTGHFIVDALWDLKPVAGAYIANLEETLEKLVEMGAPQGYVAELQRFIEHLRGGEAPASTRALGQNKRPGSGDHRGKQKRMK
ncbi:MAG: hypothetical protein M1837_002253 [Sclerophora amabilis]|nr:MAG: hypothetical protein M1837_002253 [Sclerophora amabilis]